MPLTARPELFAGLEGFLAGIPNTKIAVAVSGGGDSMALLHMLAQRGTGLRAVTVDHDLRAESAAEAQFVAETCASLSVQHHILKWQNQDRSGNLQDAARRARQNLIGGWARAQDITHIALGHTLDDQAETVLLRLARGSGVDGLSGMATVRQDNGLTWVRPLLQIKRQALRDYLTAENQTWIEDPSNDDPRFDRVKARLALGHLQDLGIDAEGLASTADKMRMARGALEKSTLDLLNTVASISDVGEVVIDYPTFINAPAELRFRLVAATLCWISGAPYRPRFDSLRALLDRADTKTQTLHGCAVQLKAGKLVVRRELARVQPSCLIDQVWDHRWQVTQVGETPATHIAALGVDGLTKCENWRDTGRSRQALLTTPALWNGQDLAAAPLAGWANGWKCGLIDEKGLHKAVMTR